MNVHAQINCNLVQSEPRLAERSANRASFISATSISRLEIGDRKDFSAAIPILNEVRRSLERNLLDGARMAAFRLAWLLAHAEPAEKLCARGGLAPWQRRKVEQYLREHLEHPVQVDELAQLIPLSVSHFCRAFKETFGDTPHAYLIRLRLELAQQTMLATDEPLSQIALASGFADQAHLSKQFRRVLGETPSAWRRRNLTEAQVEDRRQDRTSQ
jgi:AraC family transcriptional regulator